MPNLMTSLALSVIWVAGGLLVGALARWAGWAGGMLGAQGGRGRTAALIVGACGALAGGWAGTLLLGRFYGSPSAAWVVVVVVTMLPRLPWPLRRGGVRAW
jgi:hypothetical protein